MARFKRTAMFMRIADGEGSTSYVPVDDYIGKESPYKRPVALAAIAVSDSGVYFSLLHPTKKNVSRYTAEVAFPNAPLSRLERKAAAATSTDGTTVFASLNGETYELRLTVDPSGLAHLSDAGGTAVELSPRGVMMDLYWYSPKVKRKCAVTFTGNFGRPGTEETLERIVSMAINSIAGLADFRTVSGINRVDVAPAKTARPVSTLRRATATSVAGSVNVWLYREDSSALAGGVVEIAVDLANANPSLPVLMCRYVPSDTIAEVFHPYMHTLDRAITGHFNASLGADFVENIVCDIVLGDVDQRTVDAITSALETLPSVQLTPSQFQYTAGA